MPVLEVEIVGESVPVAGRDLATKIAQGVAAVLKAGPGTVWVRVRFTPPSDYAENAVPAGRVKPSAEIWPRPVFVSIILRAWSGREEMKRQVRALSVVIGTACGRPPENVHVFYEPPGEGRVAFGGTLVE